MSDCIDAMKNFHKNALALEEKIQKIDETKRILESRIAGKSLDLSSLRKMFDMQSDKRFFSTERVLTMLGGKWPKDPNGFCWDTVEYFRLEKNRLIPHAGGEVIPGPDIIIKLTIDTI